MLGRKLSTAMPCQESAAGCGRLKNIVICQFGWLTFDLQLAQLISHSELISAFQFPDYRELIIFFFLLNCQNLIKKEKKEKKREYNIVPTKIWLYFWE